MISDAIKRGVTLGFCQALSEWCDGYDEPQERCEMRPCDGCACLWVRYERLPWWRKLATARPPAPKDEAVLAALLRLRVEDAASDARIEARKRSKASAALIGQADD